MTSALSRRIRLGSRSGLVLVGIAFLVWGCVYRSAVTDRVLLDQLGLLQTGIATRSVIEARLGPPEQTYEARSISAYRLIEVDGILVSRAPARRQTHYWLMLQYGVDDVLVGRSLVRAPPPVQ